MEVQGSTEISKLIYITYAINFTEAHFVKLYTLDF